MCLLNIEHDVQLADILEVLVQRLHEIVNELEEAELVLDQKCRLLARVDNKFIRFCLIRKNLSCNSTYHIIIVFHADDKIQ